MELLQHMKPQPSHPSSVVHGGAKQWWSVSLLVHCALPLFVWPCAMPPAHTGLPSLGCALAAPASGGRGGGTSSLCQLLVAKLGVLGTSQWDWKR